MPETHEWRPSADIQTLHDRAELIRRVRAYFVNEAVLEVETPVLSHFSATDVQLEQWQTTQGQALHTSPEFAMKRLIAAGSGDIFQICRVFRRDEVGRRHNPEFTMIEWYRLGMDEFELMGDVEKLIAAVLGNDLMPSVRLTYREAFQRAGLVDPHTVSDEMLRDLVTSRLNANANDWDRDECLDALMAFIVEPSLPKDSLCFVYQYPSSQAALAQHIMVDDVWVARRFELYWQGMELANGYFELTDPVEQRRRFREEQSRKIKSSGQQSSNEFDHRFLKALESGLPSCSGVALGFDRLAMLVLGKENIADVIAFTFQRS